MRKWRELRKTQEAGAASAAPPDPWAWMLAGDSKPGVHPKHAKFLEFQTIVEQILTEDTDGDWEYIREHCADCRGSHSSPWDHYIYHRNRFHSAGSNPPVGGGDDYKRDGQENNKETAEDKVE